MNLKNNEIGKALKVIDKMLNVMTVQNSSIHMRYWAPKIAKSIAQHAIDYDKTSQELGEKDENGNLKPAVELVEVDGQPVEREIPGSFKIPKENEEQFKALGEIDVEIVGRKFQLDDFKDIPITPVELDALSWLIESPEEL